MFGLFVSSRKGSELARPRCDQIMFLGALPRKDSLRTPEKAIAGASSRYSEELLCRPADENLCCAICTGLFVRPTRTACGYSLPHRCNTAAAHPARSARSRPARVRPVNVMLLMMACRRRLIAHPPLLLSLKNPLFSLSLSQAHLLRGLLANLAAAQARVPRVSGTSGGLSAAAR